MTTQNTASTGTQAPQRATYTLREAATLAGVGYTRARELARTDTFISPVIRSGRQYLVPKAPLDRLLGIGIEPEALTASKPSR